MGWEMVMVTYGERNKRELCGLGMWSLVKVADDGNGEDWPLE